MTSDRSDPVDALLEQSGVGEDELSFAQDELRRFFEHSERPDEPLYLTPHDGSVLTASDLAKELEECTPRARSYVKLWVAGNLTDSNPPRSDLARRFRDLINSR